MRAVCAFELGIEAQLPRKNGFVIKDARNLRGERDIAWLTRPTLVGRGIIAGVRRLVPRSYGIVDLGDKSTRTGPEASALLSTLERRKTKRHDRPAP